MATDNLEDNQGVRVVGEVHLHGEPIEFKTLCERVLTERTKYLVFDLDRTVHLGRNLGELLGWEICAYHSYGPGYLERAEERSDRSRFFFDWRRPAAVAHYLLQGAAVWALPGLYYLVFSKLIHRFAATRRLAYRMFGEEPVAPVQRVPRMNLFHQLSRIPLETARRLARVLWRRMRPDQVILREDIQWIKQTYPGIRIIISSASPQPMLEIARDDLGVDDIIYSAVECGDDAMAAPCFFHGSFLLLDAPPRLSSPRLTLDNAFDGKIANLQRRFPDIFAPGVESVGMTDTDHGEDYVWAHHFTRVVDINSRTPFTPFVPDDAACQEVHSAHVLTRAERERRRDGVQQYVDPRRRLTAPVRLRMSAADLAARLEPVRRGLQALIRTQQRHRAALAETLQGIERVRAGIVESLDVAVAEYNDAVGRARRAAMQRVRATLRQMSALDRRRLQLERKVALLGCKIDMEMERGRGLLTQKPL